MNAPRLSVGKGLNRRTTKHGLAVEAKFKAMVEAKLLELGAKRSPEPIEVPEGQTFAGPCVRCGKCADCACVEPEAQFSDHADGPRWIDRHGPFASVPYKERKRDWSIETRHGRLWLSVYGDGSWIAGLWGDWPRAKAAGFSHWKWNHHYHEGAAEREVEDFVRQLKAVLP